MALTSILQDFEVRQGLIVLGTSTVTSSTGMTSTLQIYGGAAIAKNLIVGAASEIWGVSTLHSDLTVEGASYVSNLTATGVVSITDNTQATTLGAGALSITGGAYLGNNLVVNGAAESTTTVASNALYVKGGVGISGSLFVDGLAVFQNDVIFAGTTTYVYSTNTVYTDNFIDLHVPDDSSLIWTVDDGKDIGFIFNYYDSADKNGFLGLDSDTRYLEWFSDGVETNGTFTNGTYGTFKTGNLVLTSSTANSGNTNTGAMQVLGGVGVAGDIYTGGEVNAGSLQARDLTLGRIVFVGADGQLVDDESLLYDPDTNELTANISSSNTTTNIAGGAAGSVPYQSAPGVTTFLPIGAAGLILVSNGNQPTWATTSTIVAGAAFTATNLFFGEQYQIPFQSGPGSTLFEDTFKYNYDTDTLITVNGQFTGTTNASSTITGALQVAGGVGIGANLFVGQHLEVLQNVVVDGGILGTRNVSFNLLNTTATTINAFGAATAITIGATTGYTDVRNELRVTETTESSSPSTGALIVSGGAGFSGNVYLNSDINIAGNITTDETSIGIVNTTATTVNFAGEATAITIGATTGYTDVRNELRVTETTEASSTDTGALIVSGGVGIAGSLVAGGSITSEDLFVQGNVNALSSSIDLINTTATTVNFAGEATAITIGATTGYTDVRNELRVTETTQADSSITGALIVSGGVGIAQNLYVGGLTVAEGNLEVRGDIVSNASTFNLINTGTTTVNFAGEATAITIGSALGTTEIRNFVHLTSSTIAVSGSSGALVVDGGVGIGSNLWVTSTLQVQGASNIANLSAQVTTATTLTVTNNATVGGTLDVDSTQNSNAVTNGALRVAGGIGVEKDIYAGGAITVGATGAATTGTTVSALFSNNTLISTFTKPNISGSSSTDLDTYNAAIYRSARYFVQITDGSDIHISEISVFHDGIKAYINEYGIATNNGQLGSFDADLVTGSIVIRFTPLSATDMSIKMVRTAITI